MGTFVNFDILTQISSVSLYFHKLKYIFVEWYVQIDTLFGSYLDCWIFSMLSNVHWSFRQKLHAIALSKEQIYYDDEEERAEGELEAATEAKAMADSEAMAETERQR